MIKKIQGSTKIKRLRLINVYEVYYNLILKYFWPHKATYHTYQHNLLDKTQWDTRPMYSAENAILID